MIVNSTKGDSKEKFKSFFYFTRKSDKFYLLKFSKALRKIQ